MVGDFGYIRINLHMRCGNAAHHSLSNRKMLHVVGHIWLFYLLQLPLGFRSAHLQQLTWDKPAQTQENGKENCKK